MNNKIHENFPSIFNQSYWIETTFQQRFRRSLSYDFVDILHSQMLSDFVKDQDLRKKHLSTRMLKLVTEIIIKEILFHLVNSLLSKLSESFEPDPNK